MPGFVVTDTYQMGLKGGGAGKRMRFVTITGDATTYGTNGFAITSTAVASATGTLLMPNTILGMNVIASSGAIGLSNIYYDLTNTTIRMSTTGGVELGAGNSTAFTSSNVIKVLFWGT